ncbi:MAG: hypothetical protein LUF33_00935 [Clostridiales bacterium]|nr:hypothetical protein [Clostridiales bacterium]
MNSSSKTTKKKVLTSALAVALAAVLLIGGASIAYLQDSTPTVTNTFETNSVNVDLTEDETEFEIIPGTSEEKNPTVTVTATVDSYVFVKVVDRTQGLVDYEIADGWTLLKSTTSGVATTNIYYRKVTGSDNEQSYSVLLNNNVSYDASLTNEDLAAASGKVTLAFTAYAIQAEPFSGADEAEKAQNAYTAASATAMTVAADGTVTTYTSLSSAISNAADGSTIELNKDTSVSYFTSSKDKEITVDLNSHTLSLTSTYSTTVSKTDLTIENGTIEAATGSSSAAAATFAVRSGATLTLENVTATTTGALLYPRGDATEVNVINSDISATGSYAIATNAASADNYNCVINVENSTLYGAACGILINVPCTMNVSDSTITGDRQTVIVRAGTANISDTELINTQTDEDVWTSYDNINWGSGNAVATAVLTIGNRNGSYSGDATVTLSGVTCTYDETLTNSRGVYLYGGVTYPTTNTTPTRLSSITIPPVASAKLYRAKPTTQR